MGILDNVAALLLQFPVETGNVSIGTIIVCTHLLHFLNEMHAAKKAHLCLYCLNISFAVADYFLLHHMKLMNML